MNQKEYNGAKEYHEQLLSYFDTHHKTTWGKTELKYKLQELFIEYFTFKNRERDQQIKDAINDFEYPNDLKK